VEGLERLMRRASLTLEAYRERVGQILFGLEVSMEIEHERLRKVKGQFRRLAFTHTSGLLSAKLSQTVLF